MEFGHEKEKMARLHKTGPENADSDYEDFEDIEADSDDDEDLKAEDLKDIEAGVNDSDDFTVNDEVLSTTSGLGIDYGDSKPFLYNKTTLYHTIFWYRTL